MSKHSGTVFALGEAVEIKAIVVGRSEFQKGQPTYLVEYGQKGRTVQEWFHADDLALEGGR